jgi:hypothetical protein
MTAKPGRTIYNLASLTNSAYQASLTVKNIVTAFCTPDLQSFPRLAYSTVYFQSSYVTDRELSALELSFLSNSLNKMDTICYEGSATSKASLTPAGVSLFVEVGPRHENRRSEHLSFWPTHRKRTKCSCKRMDGEMNKGIERIKM